MSSNHADRMKDITPFIVMDLVKGAQDYDDTIHFEIGQPDIPPSPKVIEAMKKAVDDGMFSYTESLGLLALREKISANYLSTYGVKVDPSRILLTPGTSGAFLVAYSLALGRGDKIALTDPSYPCYKNFAHLLDLEPVFIPIDEGDDFQLRPEKLAKVDAKAVHITSPSNPIGNVYDGENLDALIKMCESKGMSFISDELYHGLEYDAKCHTALEYSDSCYVINGFSKYYCMPGFRLGWIVVPEERKRDAEILAQNLFISPPTLSQYAALEAFDPKQLEYVRNTYRTRRDFLVDALKDVFKLYRNPEGAFYCWMDVSEHTDDSYDFAFRMLKDIHVAVAPGVDFGSNGTKKYLRFSYTRNIEHMAEGVRRIKEWLS